jgi:sulfide:quinone oxidoreductase
MSTKKHQIVIVGGGTAGLSAAANFCYNHNDRNLDVAIIEPSEKHYYQPLWTIVGAGVFPKEDSERNQADYTPYNATWIKEKVDTFQPEKNQVTLGNGDVVEYDYLVVAPGIQINWGAIKGLKETLGKNGVCSNYSYDTVEYTWENIRNLKSGRAIFTQPAMPIKCAGAPQKIAYLADDYFRKQNVRNNVEVMFAAQGPRIFGVEKYRIALEKLVKKKEITTRFEHNLIEVKGEEKKAVFQKVGTDETVEIEYDMLHVVPPMGAPDFIKESPIANSESGYVDVDMYTCQHVKYSNIFSAGDASSLPTSKTGAAVRKQIPVLVQNILSHMDGKELKGKYNGYASCPLVTGYGSVILAEFDYDGNPDESFPFDQSEERFSMYLLKAYGLPRLYWHGMLKGKA